MVLISIEGPDGCGKSTIANLILNLVREKHPNKRVIRTALPSTRITGMFTNLLRNSADKISPEVFALVYAADHLHHWQSLMKGMPKDSIVVQERSLLSSYVYQGLVGKLDMAWLREINKYCKTIPDLTLIIQAQVDVMVSRKAGENGHDIFETKEHIEKQANVYYKLPEDLKKEFNVVLVDGNKNPLDVATACFALIEKRLGKGI
jgi:dTMP kinase